MRWSTSDSPMPATRNSRTINRTPVESRASRGSTCAANMAFSSCGGPGSKMKMRSAASIQRPGAVPRSLSRTIAPSGTFACRLFTSDIARPSWRKRASILLITAGSRDIFLPSRSATASRVRSSSVGPRPPLAIINSTRFAASSKAARSGARSSPTTVLRVTSIPRRFSCAVMNRELVSTRSGVSSSDPTAMISAFMFCFRSAWKREAFHFPVDGEECARCGQNGAVSRQKREAHDAAAAEDEIGAPIRGNLHDAAASLVGRGYIEVSLAIECQALRAAKAAKKRADFALLIDAQDAVKTRCRRSGDKQFACGAERQVIGRDGRLDHGENKNLAVGINFKNCAAAVAYKKVSNRVEGDACRDAHTFHPQLRAAIRRDAMNRSIVAAGNIQIPVAVEREACGIHKFRDERFYFVVGRNFVKRNGDLLPSMAAISHINIALRVHRGIGDGVKIVGNLHAKMKGNGLARGARRFHADNAARGAIRHARDQIVLSRD